MATKTIIKRTEVTVTICDYCKEEIHRKDSLKNMVEYDVKWAGDHIFHPECLDKLVRQFLKKK